LREEHRLGVSENRVLRIFGPKREEDRSWRKLDNDELHNLYSSYWIRVAQERVWWRAFENTVMNLRVP
jgi:SRSO17 transposase